MEPSRISKAAVPGREMGSPWLGGPAAGREIGDLPRLLLLCDYRPHEAATVIDHIDAIRRWSRNAVYVLAMHGDLPDELDLEAFDGLLIHYNLVMTSDWHLSALARWRISRYSGVKGAFIQDEYRFVDDTVGVLATLGVAVLFSCVPSDEVDKVYPKSRLPKLRRVVNVLTGYVPDALLREPVQPYDARPIDVAYRGRRLPAWLGELAREKALIGDRFAADAERYGLTVDISSEEGDRLYGKAWIRFLGGAKAVLGVESGASVFDFDGSVERAVRGHLSTHPDASFEELRESCFSDAEGRIRLNQISPRSFEAAALGTLMIMYPGDYSGILRPWRHYVPLQRDHSNMDEVVAAIRDPGTWSEITRRARDEVALAPANSYHAMTEIVDAGLDLSRSRRPQIATQTYLTIATRSYAALPHTRLRELRLPPQVNRLRLLAPRVARMLTPSAVAIARTAAHEGETLPRLRGALRHARALSYWGLRPAALPLTSLIGGGRVLLEDLAVLRRLQEVGRRAIHLTGTSPYVLVVRVPTREASLVVRHDGWLAADLYDRAPRELESMTALRLDLDDRWLAPLDGPDASRARLEALSALMAAQPRIGAGLIAGPTPWCAFAIEPLTR